MISVTIVDDEIYEDDEQLFLVLESGPSDVNIVFSPGVAMLTIVDNDSKERNLCLLIRVTFIKILSLASQFTAVKVAIENQAYRVREDHGTVHVCVVVDSEPRERIVEILWYTREKSAVNIPWGRHDFVAIQELHNLNETILRSCVTIIIIDDSRVEDTEEFTVTINSFDPDVVFTTQTATVIIQDNDEAVIGFEMAKYRGEEGQMVEVCVTVDSIMETSMPIQVNVSVEDKSTEGWLNFIHH